MTAPDWRDDANCLGCDTESFFPEKGGRGGIWFAKAVCAGCDVREACLDYAIEHHIWDGIWGGMTPMQRRTVARDRRKAVA